MISTFRVEMSKQLRRIRTYVALGIVVVLPVIMTLAVKYGERGRRADNPEALFQIARNSGLVMPAAALLFMSRFLLVVVVAIFAGDAVAGEASWGNLRYVLVRPIGRARLLWAKLAMAAVFIVIATGLIVITGLLAGGLAFGWHRDPSDLAVRVAWAAVVGSAAQLGVQLPRALRPELRSEEHTSELQSP